MPLGQTASAKSFHRDPFAAVKTLKMSGDVRAACGKYHQSMRLGARSTKFDRAYSSRVTLPNQQEQEAFTRAIES
jgi:hypothetical protein